MKKPALATAALALFLCSPSSLQVDAVPTVAPSFAPEPTVVSEPTTTVPPTYSEPCFLCGDPELSVEPTLEIEVQGQLFSCGEVEETAQSGQVSPEECVAAIPVVVAGCNCTISTPPSMLPTAPPTTASSSPQPTNSLSPTYTEPCYVCGDPELSVDPTLEIEFAGQLFPCAALEETAQSGQVSPEECVAAIPVVVEGCNCTMGTNETSMPSGSTVSPVSANPGNATISPSPTVLPDNNATSVAPIAVNTTTDTPTDVPTVSPGSMAPATPTETSVAAAPTSGAFGMMTQTTSIVVSLVLWMAVSRINIHF